MQTEVHKFGSKTLVDNDVDRLQPQGLDNLLVDDASKGKCYTCLECGEPFTEGKSAKVHRSKTGHNCWVRHPKLPGNWTNPYVEHFEEKHNQQKH